MQSDSFRGGAESELEAEDTETDFKVSHGSVCRKRMTAAPCETLLFASERSLHSGLHQRDINTHLCTELDDIRR